MSNVKKFIVVVSLVICAIGSGAGQHDEFGNYDEFSSTDLTPVEEEEFVTKNYYTVGQTSTTSDVQSMSCNYQDNWYKEGEEFRMGPKNCSICTCINMDIRCNDDDCFTQFPEVVETEAAREKLKIEDFNTTADTLIPDVLESEANNKYDTTELLINCCNIGTYMPNCSDTGIDSVMVNPPAGLCRSTIKHCCMLANKELYEPIQFQCNPELEEHMTCCAVCKVGKHLPDPQANFKSLMTHCCDAAQPLIQHKREKHSCQLGYTWSNTTSRCEDIDECQIKNNGCCESQDCENFDGGYRCIPRRICKAGYEFDEDYLECRDYRYTVVNETEEVEQKEVVQVTETQPEDLTFNEPLKVDIPTECMLGYQYDPETDGCVDINECLNNPCQQTCKNLDGNFQCSCKRGFISVGTQCEDIDECEKNPCSHICVNVIGSFRCHCPTGMSLGFDRKRCIEQVFNATCPEQYKTHKTVDDKAFLKCVRTPCVTEIEKCKSLPKYLTYKSITLPRNFRVSQLGYQIFNIKTKSIKVKVEHKTKVNVEHKGPRVRPASVRDFSIKQEPNRILVSLIRPLSGPQTFTLNINLIKDETKIMESIEIKIIVE